MIRKWSIAVMLGASLTGNLLAANDGGWTDEAPDPEIAYEEQFHQTALQPEPTLPEVEVQPPFDDLPPVQNYQPPSNVGAFADPFGGVNRMVPSPFGGVVIPWDSSYIRGYADRVGPYNQPSWTTQRPFATTRAYVLPPGQARVEQWVRPTWSDGERKFRMLEEFAVGLPGRFQLDIYERWNVEPDDSGSEVANHEGVQLELRWAVANWGVIPFNPTLYAEWVERGGPQDKPNVYELKLLLSENLMEDLFFASNVVLEQEVSGSRATEWAWSNAFGTPIIDNCLIGGVEMVYTVVTEHGSRHDQGWEFMIGPSLHWNMTNRWYLDVVGLFGTTNDAAQARMFIVAAYQFGFRSGPSRYAPTSTIGN